jgi:hypothetical protein
MTNFPLDNIDELHLAEFRSSAIADDIAALNFRSWIPDNENDLDEAFTLLIRPPAKVKESSYNRYKFN